MNIEKIIVFDIETAGRKYHFNSLDKSFQNEFISRLKREDNYTESELCDVEFLQKHWVKKSPVYPEYGRIICISYAIQKDGVLHTKTIYEDNEKDILLKFKNLCILAEQRGLVLSGWNIKNFDIPWIWRKMVYYNISRPTMLKITNKKPWNLDFIDLKEIIKCNSSIVPSLNETLLSSNIPSPKEGDVNGANTHQAFWDNRIEEIKDYCELDVQCTHQLLTRVIDDI
jgi:predicted PolB exonuclease-like 3'-5' exonuclease